MRFRACFVLTLLLCAVGAASAAEPINFPNSFCRELYVTKYRDRPAPKIFFSHYSPTFKGITCNRWIKADKSSPTHERLATAEEAIAYTRSKTQQFMLLASEEKPQSAGEMQAAAGQADAIDPKPGCDGYPVKTLGRGPLGTVCRCDYGGPIQADMPGWWAVIPDQPNSPVLACRPPK